MTPDVNVLVAASRSDHPHHAVARTWLEHALAAAESGAAFTLMPMVITSLLRLVTSPRIFVQPTPIADAVTFVDAILAVPGVHLASLGTATISLTHGWPQRAISPDLQLDMPGMMIGFMVTI